MSAHTTFDAIGTSVFVATRASADLEAATRIVRAVIVDVDETCSRFRADSDLTRANRSAGRWVEVDPLLAHAVDVARRAAIRTGGLVDPLLGVPLVRLGYDRDLTALWQVDQPAHDDLGAHPDAWHELAVDLTGAVRVPAGTALDLGSIGKAWIADLAAAWCADTLRQPALISVGGDLAISRADGDPWQIGVSERPGRPPEVLVQLTEGAMATSTTTHRRWTAGGAAQHHLLDPRTGRPVSGPWRTATVAASSAVVANTASTAALVLQDRAPAWLEDRGFPCRLIGHDGDELLLGSWPATDRVIEAATR